MTSSTTRSGLSVMSARGTGGGAPAAPDVTGLGDAPPDPSAPVQQAAMGDAVEAYSSNLAVWMRANGVVNPSAAEAARLRLLSDRLVEQRSSDDFDGAVATWLETRLGSGVRPTRNERNVAARKVQAFFVEGGRLAGTPTQQRGGRGKKATAPRGCRAH